MLLIAHLLLQRVQCSGLSFRSRFFLDAMPLGISGTFNYMLVFQTEHNILMQLPHAVSLVSSVVLCSVQCTVLWLPLRWFVKPPKLSPRTMVTSSVKRKRLQHRRRSRLLWSSDLPIRIVQLLRSLHFFLAA